MAAAHALELLIERSDVMGYGIIRGQSNIKDFLTNSKTLPACIYHYTSPQGLVYILESGSIRFYDYHYMNDISELEYVYTLVEELLLLPEFEKLRIQLHRYARETGQTGPVPRSPEMFRPYFSEDAKGYYLFCASKSPDSLCGITMSKTESGKEQISGLIPRH